MAKKGLINHPPGLFVLFFTEMWERFSYYGMRALLVLFLVSSAASDNPGMGWSKDDALLLYGIYTAMVYIMSIPGGLLADRILGQRKTVMLGGGLLCAGHLLMVYTEPWAFFTALTLIVLGVGGLKPNISTMVGGLYKKGDPRRDSGFTIFYMGINLGSLLAGLIIGAVGEIYGWHWGFSLAGIGMILGQIVYMLGQPYVRHVGNLDKKQDALDEMSDEGVVESGGAKYKTAKREPDGVSKGFTSQEKDRLKVIFISFFIVIIFWMSFEQAGGLMNLFTFERTDRSLSPNSFLSMIFGAEIPATVFQSLNAGFIVLFALPIAWIWSRLSSAGRNPGAIFKMGLGAAIMGLGFVFMVFAVDEYKAEGSSSMYWLALAYLFHTLGELCLSPVSLSFITKVAPPKIVSSMMGTFFAVTGLANFLAAMIGRAADDLGEYTIFLGLTIFPIFFGLMLMLFSQKLKKLTHGTDT